MRGFAFVLFLASGLLSNPGSILFAQWTQTNGPYSGNITSLAVTPNEAGGTNLFAGTSFGVFRSTDNGANWAEVIDGLVDLMVRTLAVLPDGAGGTNLFAGTYRGVSLSTNNGTTWIHKGLTNTYVSALAVSGVNLFAGTGRGVFVSTNNGASWDTSSTPFTSFIQMLQVGNRLFAATGEGGVYLSTDNGTSWTPVNTGLTNTWVHALAVSGVNLFAGTNGGVFVSTNDGASWGAASTPFGSFSQMLEVGNKLIAATREVGASFVTDGICVSTDNGMNWIRLGSTGTVIHDLAVSGDNLVAGTDGGVFLSTDNGMSWTQIGLKYAAATRLAVWGTNLYAGMGSYTAGVCLSTDNGRSWTGAKNGLDWDTGVRAFAGNGTDLFVATPYDGVFQLTDHGTRWVPVNTGLPSAVIYALVASGTNLFAGAGNGVFLSVNSGNSWTRTGPLNFDVSALAVSGTSLFAGTFGGGIFFSSTSGATWTAVNDGLPQNLAVAALEVSGTNLFAAAEVNGIFVSTNSGASWDSATAPFTSFSQMLQVGERLFAATRGGVFLSTDNGTSWTPINTGLRDASVAALAVIGMYLFAGTYSGGVWRRPMSEMIATGGLSVTVQNNPGWEEIGDEGTVYLYDRSGQRVDSAATGSDGVAVFDVVVPDTGYSCHVYRTSRSGDRVFGTEYWGACSGVTVAPGQTTAELFIRNMPRTSNLHVYNETTGQEVTGGMVTAGTALRVTVDVSNPSSPGASQQKVKGQVVLDRDRAVPYDMDRTDTTYGAIAAGTVHVFEVRFAPESEGEYYGVTGTLTEVGGSPVYTQSGRWITEPVLRVVSALAAPELLYPPDEATGVEGAPVLRWNTREEATAYHVMVSLDSLFTASLVDTTTADTSYALSLLEPLTAYWWKVASIGISGQGAFTPRCRFTTREWLSVKEKEIPREFSLQQNYPNPFNPATTIRYALPVRSHVNLSVFNSLGQLVALLVQGEQEPGYHEASVDATNLASGVYLYRLQAADFVQTKRLILLR